MHSDEIREEYPEHYDDEGNCRHKQVSKRVGGCLVCKWCGRVMGHGSEIPFYLLPIGAHFQSAFDEVGKAPTYIKLRESRTGVCDSRRIDMNKPTASHGPLSPVVPVKWPSEQENES